YNEALWPAPEVLGLVAFVAVCLALFPGSQRDRIACALLSVLWAWSGLIYCCGFLSRITPLGYVFGAVFAMQAALLLNFGVARHDVRFWTHTGPRHLAGILLLTRAPYARELFAVPLFWAAMGTWLAFELRLREDIGLIVAAALVLTMTP